MASTDPDAALVERARRGDREAFGQLYRRHAGLVRAVLLARLRWQEVPDLVQDVFLVAWTRLATLRRSEAFAGWIATIARNRAFEHQRRHVEFTELRDVEGRTPSDGDAFEMLDMIAELPEAYRETLVLRFVEGMTGPEIASRTGLAEGSVRVNLHRGTRLLRERLRSMERGS
jgi:RNA polymerase sigma-70 factor (ECF subfamily)